MTLGPLEILALPGVASAAVRSVGSAIGRLTPGSFADHLNRAQGEAERLPVKVGRGVEVELSAEQLTRLAEAADRAEAEGVSTAVVMIDGLALELDVTMRTVRGVVDEASGIKTGIDAVVYALPAPEKKAAFGPGALPENPGVRKLAGGSGEAA